MKLEKVEKPKITAILTFTEDEIAIINHILLAYGEAQPYTDKLGHRGKMIANQLYELLQDDMIFNINGRL